jgi:hypothetical protein
MLDVTRCQVEEFLKDTGLSWRTDTSNADTQYRRNFIRHQLLPLAKERLNARADEAILRLAGAASQIDEFLTELAQQALDSARRGGPCAFDRAVLAGQKDVVLGYALRLALEQSEVPLREVGARRIEDLQTIVRAGAGAIDLPGGFRAKCEGPMLVIMRQEHGVFGVAHRDLASHGRDLGNTSQVNFVPTAAVAIACPGVVSLPGGASISCRRQPITPEEFAKHCLAHPHGLEWLDADQVQGPLLCRPVRADDAFWPLGASCRRLVREFLKKQSRGTHKRPEAFCICDELGILYVAPLRIDARVRVTERTREVMVLETCHSLTT